MPSRFPVIHFALSELFSTVFNPYPAPRDMPYRHRPRGSGRDADVRHDAAGRRRD